MCSRPFSTSRFAHLCCSRPRGCIHSLLPSSLYLDRSHWHANTQRAAIARAFTKARTERSICFGVVAQSQTLIRITAFPCQVEPPHQHSPERWMFCSVALVRAIIAIKRGSTSLQFGFSSSRPCTLRPLIKESEKKDCWMQCCLPFRNGLLFRYDV